MTLRFSIFLLSVGLLGGGLASDGLAQKLEGRVVEHTLANGMKLILMERHAAPVVSAVIRFHVGSVDEEPGKTGLAHLYEHLAFRGTEIIGTLDYERELRIRAAIDSLGLRRAEFVDAGRSALSEDVRGLDEEIASRTAELDSILVVEELDQIYNLNGSVGLNASTTADLTTFVVSLPANRLPLWAALESDRMAHSVPRDFEAERLIVAKEKRARFEDEPEASLYREFLKTAFQVHPYGRPVPGLEGDLESVALDDAYAFYRAYYSPNNAVAAVVGDIEIEQTIALAETTFGLVPCRPLPCDRTIPSEPPQTEKRTVLLEADAEPALFMGFHKPDIRNPDDLAFEVLSKILTEGNRSRLTHALFVEKRMAMDFSSWIGPGDRYPNLFIIAARPIWPHTAEEVEQAVWVELERLAREPVSDEELRRAKNLVSAGFLRGLEDNRGMAEQLSYYGMVTGDWRDLERRVAAIESIAPDDIRRSAARYLIPENCTTAGLVSTRRTPDG